ncbi:hypothetical protein RFI_25422 [Reticulomyxa filosa]|uniref:Uncharacterized protein n=1 Tax=Reticulomyxa filosa TaxID=46433 RepID=X6MEX3_RETFI|nr:hypothetical protein RFI_25422 [Reticulomyxa filosa]|eukprot:ETO11952.1 hypothetical protein RFI_25422 [Reticulomyxa filosa]
MDTKRAKALTPQIVGLLFDSCEIKTKAKTKTKIKQLQSLPKSLIRSQQTQNQTEPVIAPTDQTNSDLPVLLGKHSTTDSVCDVYMNDGYDRRSTFVVKEEEVIEERKDEEEEAEEFVHVDNDPDLQTRNVSMGESPLHSRLVNAFAESNDGPMAYVQGDALIEVKHSEEGQHVLSNSEINTFQCSSPTANACIQNQLDNSSVTNIVASVVLTNSHCDGASKDTFDDCSVAISTQTQMDNSVHDRDSSGDLESID